MYIKKLFLVLIAITSIPCISYADHNESFIQSPAGAIALFRMKPKVKQVQAITLNHDDIKPIEVTLTANKTTANIERYVTFTAKAEGGIPPYTYYWWLDGDKSWTLQASNIYTRQITRPVKQTMYLVVKDSRNKATQEYSLSIEVIGTPPAPQPPPSKEKP